MGGRSKSKYRGTQVLSWPKNQVAAYSHLYSRLWQLVRGVHVLLKTGDQSRGAAGNFRLGMAGNDEELGI